MWRWMLLIQNTKHNFIGMSSHKDPFYFHMVPMFERRNKVTWIGTTSILRKIKAQNEKTMSNRENQKLWQDSNIAIDRGDQFMHKNHGFRNVMLIMVVTELLFKLPIPYKNQISIRTRAPYDGASPHRKTNTWPQGKIIMSLKSNNIICHGKLQLLLSQNNKYEGKYEITDKTHMHFEKTPQ